MESADLDVLRHAAAWQKSGKRVALATVVGTYGSAPRAPGALVALRDDGSIAGSVSGGCVEDDLSARLRQAWPEGIEILKFGGGEESRRLRLPCGGTIELLLEPSPEPDLLCDLIDCIAARRVIARRVDLLQQRADLQPAQRLATEFGWDGQTLHMLHGPTWRLVIIGAGQPSRFLAQMAQSLNYEVIVCDPRDDYAALWDVSAASIHPGMPDDVVADLKPDARTAVIALTHDPKLDDLALLEALDSDAFFVGAIGSRANQNKRRARLRELGLSEASVARLHGPVGLPIGSKTPAEIAVSILAELTALRRGASLARFSAADQALRSA